MRVSLFAAFVCGIAQVLPAQIGPPSLLRDLNLTPPPYAFGSNASGWAEFAGQLWFVADDPVTGRELHVTDGTVAGTRLVADLTPGSAGGVWGLTVAGNSLFFVLGDGLRSGLWKVDASGVPSQVFAIGDGEQETGPAELTALGGQLFFSAADEASGSELWVSDGTTSGTRMLIDFDPGHRSGSPRALTTVGNRLLFTVDAGGFGREFWGSDGTPGGTALLVDSRPGGWSGEDLRVVPGDLGGQRLFFATGDLYVTDGTPAGTRVLQRGLEALGHDDAALVIGGGVAMFPAETDRGRRGMWRSDGTAAGTYELRSSSSTPRPVGVVAGRVVFAADGLYGSDGTVAGTTALSGVPVAHPLSGVAVGGNLVFTGVANGLGLFATDGSSAWQLRGGLQSAGPIDTVALGRAWFSLNDGSGTGGEPWTSDGTAAGTRLFADLASRPAGATWHGNPRDVVAVGSGIAFLADSGTGAHSVFRSDGTGAGTVSGPAYPGTDPFGSRPGRLLGRAGRLFTATEPAPGSGVIAFHADDGSGPVELARIGGGRTGMLPWRDGIAVVANDPLLSDGTSAGSRRIVLDPGAPTTRSYWGVTVGSSLFVHADTGAPRMFRIDGGTVTSLGSVNSYSVPGFAADGFVFFDGPGRGDDPNDIEPYVSDGTAAGTGMLVDLWPGASGSYPTPLGRVPGGLLFHAWDGNGEGIWFTDGTAAGTIRLPGALAGGYLSYDYTAAILVGNSLLVTVYHPTAGFELALSSSSGSQLLDLHPGSGSSRPRHFETVGSEVWFVADVPGSGRTLMRTDGSAAGTVPITTLDSEPSFLRLRQGRVWLDLADPAHGLELWSIDPGAVVEEVGHACGAGLQLPSLSATDPVLGGAWTVRGRGGVSGQPGLLALGLPASGSQRVVGWCHSALDLASAVVVAGFADSGSDWSWTTTLPGDPALKGLAVVAQSWSAEPGGPGSLGSSAGLRATFGTF